MNIVNARSNIAPLFSGARPTRRPSLASRPVVFLRQVSADQWQVRDLVGLRGGTFRDLKSAQKFIRNDFASSATVVFQPRFKITDRNS